MVRANFFIIGAAKSATTTLANLLMNHPQAAIVKDKEPHFFSFNNEYPEGIEWYLNQYDHCTKEIAIGDASTSYSRIRYYPETIERIHDFNPDAKIIFCVRHPLKRIESAYIERIATSGTAKYNSLNESVRNIHMMVDSSRYWEVFDAYRQFFPEKNILIVWFEDFTQNQQQLFTEICQFLDINEITYPMSASLQTNSRAVKHQQINSMGQTLKDFDLQWDDDTRAYVIDKLREDNLQLLRYFNKPDDYWGNIF